MAKQAKVLNRSEFKRLIGAAERSRHAVRNKTMIYVSYYAGARACEIAGLRVCDVVGENGEILSVITLSAEQTKGSKRGRMFVSKKLARYLKEYLQENDNLMNERKNALFRTQKRSHFSAQTVVNLFAKLYEEAFVSGASSHSGRRTFITKLADKAVNPRVIQELARHSNLNTTMRYIDVNENKLSNAVNMFDLH